ncbi:hypothetical protein ACSU1N_02770 [Thermogladius sp. 4427co]|uniref:hypothetical protein n=1 Tax=Thermogladius sp. 4427co TaxID=3450718 RepID=UPI003F78EC0C
MKGVDGLVAAALLLVITVAGGLLIYNYVMNYLSLPQQYASLKIVSAKINILNDNSSVLTLQVSNLGNIPVNITSIRIYTGSGNYSVNYTTQVPAGSSISVNIPLNSTVTGGVKSSAQVYVSAVYTVNNNELETDLVKTPVY